MADGHYRTAERVAARLLGDGRATGVVLHGSVAQNAHRPASDVDLVAIGPTSVGFEILEVNGLRIELITRTFDGWLEAFAREVPAWAYAWTDGVVLVQSGRNAESLVAAGTRALQSYRPRRSSLVEHVEFWEHVRPKLAEAASRGDDTEIGYSMGLSMQRLVESLFLMNDVVPSPVSNMRTFDRLLHLPAPERLDARLRTMLTHPDVRTRAQEKLILIDDLVEAIRAKLDRRPD
ncbi:nucleotidyltransferase domain-containing protein [Microbacterium sp. A8/3-1]|uniref:Nucleotidyltransferase domain-containing protein n=1 Tax=Microbacterium sp. A8/3-1 TaxID=3160749 RepID=A0AAU7W426_9MICO